MGLNVIAPRETKKSFAPDDGIINRAKQKDLLQFLDLNLIKHFHQGSSRGSNYCPNCGQGSEHSNKVSISNNLWDCWACEKGGSLVDYAAYHWDISIVEASRKLLGEVEGSALKQSTGISRAPEPRLSIKPVLTKILRDGHTWNKDAVAYLRDKRGISESLILEASQRGMLRFLPSNPRDAMKHLKELIGEHDLKKYGFWKEGSKMPGIAFRPIVFLMPDLECAEFRLIGEPKEGERKAIAYGDKNVPWHWKGVDSSKVAIVEGFIDMLSMVEFGYKGDIKALPGVKTWKDDWIGDYDELGAFLDNDEEGHAWTEKVVSAAKIAEMIVKVRHPPAGDVNRELTNHKGITV